MEVVKSIEFLEVATMPKKTLPENIMVTVLLRRKRLILVLVLFILESSKVLKFLPSSY